MPGDPKECREHAKNCLELPSNSPPLSLARSRAACFTTSDPVRSSRRQK